MITERTSMKIVFLAVNYSLITSGGIGSYLHTAANGLVLCVHLSPSGFRISR